MDRVLLATHDQTFSVSLADDYRARGCLVSTGVDDLFKCAGTFDLVHCHWPDELCKWDLSVWHAGCDRMIDALDYWQSRTLLVCTVHNDLPHATKSEAARRAYLEFYRRMHVIGHFTEHSRRVVCERFPELLESNHVVHGMNDFRDLLPLSVGRHAAREKLALTGGKPTAGVIGQLRHVRELKLLQAAFSNRQIKVVFAARAPKSDSRFKKWALRLSVEAWAVLFGHKLIRNYLSDEELVTVLEGCDCIVIPRIFNELNSGIVPLALTFGIPVCAPRAEPFIEITSGAGCALYDPGNAKSLAQAVSSIGACHSHEIKIQIAQVLSNWGWNKAVDRLLGVKNPMNDDGPPFRFGKSTAELERLRPT